MRGTLDIDIFVRPSQANAERVVSALRAWGAPIARHGVSSADFAKPDTVYQLGLPPRRIDILTSIDGVSFDQACEEKIEVSMKGLVFPVIGRKALLANIGLQAMVAVLLGHDSGAQVEAFFEGIGSDTAVIAIYYLAGATDFLVHVTVRDTYALRRVVVEVMGTRAEISHVETSLIFDHKSTAMLACDREPEA